MNAQGDRTPDIERIATVTVELAYEDALRLWVLVNDPANARQHRADERIGKLVTDAIHVTEDNYAR